MKAKILGAALIGVIVGGIAMSSIDVIKPAIADDGFDLVNSVMTISKQNVVFYRAEDVQAKVVCYTAYTRGGTPIGVSCVKKD